jgi:DNA-binding transcriptional LysR family regulator
MWLIPRLEAFQHDNPDIDIRIDASDNALDLDVADVDLALRYGPVASMPPNAIRMFGEQLTPVASPWLIKIAAAACAEKARGPGELCTDRGGRRPPHTPGVADLAPLVQTNAAYPSSRPSAGCTSTTPTRWCRPP